MTDHPRDLVGYGEAPPHPRWPGGARLALQIVVNVLYPEVPPNGSRQVGELAKKGCRLPQLK